MKYVLLLLTLAAVASCTKTKTVTVTVTVHDTALVSIPNYTRNLWIASDGSGATLSFTKDSIYELLPVFSATPFGYPYTVLGHDTINLPSRNLKMIVKTSGDSLWYNDFKNGIIVHFYRD